MMLSIFCPTSRHLGSQLSSKNSTDCVAAAPWYLQRPSKDQDAAEAMAFWLFVLSGKPISIQGTMQSRLWLWDLQHLPGLQLCGHPQNAGGREKLPWGHLDVGTRYVLDISCVTPSTLTLTFSSSKPVLAHKQAKWQRSVLWATAWYFAFLGRH